ncbi:hypothetical protein AcW1_007383 [Taiwanofungus camphoratus]|nr:hypothetical protein AcW2_007551 [Antrodia cinnamomea]KAI0920099.1 hypothetical protein AcV7_006092 [Antrodia cinnamomea]KAI0953062.1 hypothetical protein AcW1_007383 [Antrodia cinnamomea]
MSYVPSQPQQLSSHNQSPTLGPYRERQVPVFSHTRAQPSVDSDKEDPCDYPQPPPLSAKARGKQRAVNAPVEPTEDGRYLASSSQGIDRDCSPIDDDPLPPAASSDSENEEPVQHKKKALESGSTRKKKPAINVSRSAKVQTSKSKGKQKARGIPESSSGGSRSQKRVRSPEAPVRHSGRQPGASGYGDSDLYQMCKLIQEILPIGPDEWAQVVVRFN